MVTLGSQGKTSFHSQIAPKVWEQPVASRWSSSFACSCFHWLLLLLVPATAGSFQISIRMLGFIRTHTKFPYTKLVEKKLLASTSIWGRTAAVYHLNKVFVVSKIWTSSEWSSKTFRHPIADTVESPTRTSHACTDVQENAAGAQGCFIPNRG